MRRRAAAAKCYSSTVIHCFTVTLLQSYIAAVLQSVPYLTLGAPLDSGKSYNPIPPSIYQQCHSVPQYLPLKHHCNIHQSTIALYQLGRGEKWKVNTIQIPKLNLLAALQLEITLGKTVSGTLPPETEAIRYLWVASAAQIYKADCSIYFSWPGRFCLQ